MTKGININQQTPTNAGAPLNDNHTTPITNTTNNNNNNSDKTIFIDRVFKITEEKDNFATSFIKSFLGKNNTKNLRSFLEAGNSFSQNFLTNLQAKKDSEKDKKELVYKYLIAAKFKDKLFGREFVANGSKTASKYHFSKAKKYIESLPEVDKTTLGEILTNIKSKNVRHEALKHFNEASINDYLKRTGEVVQENTGKALIAGSILGAIAYIVATSVYNARGQSSKSDALTLGLGENIQGAGIALGIYGLGDTLLDIFVFSGIGTFLSLIIAVCAKVYNKIITRTPEDKVKYEIKKTKHITIDKDTKNKWIEQLNYASIKILIELNNFGLNAELTNLSAEIENFIKSIPASPNKKGLYEVPLKSSIKIGNMDTVLDHVDLIHRLIRALENGNSDLGNGKRIFKTSFNYTTIAGNIKSAFNQKEFTGDYLELNEYTIEKWRNLIDQSLTRLDNEAFWVGFEKSQAVFKTNNIRQELTKSIIAFRKELNAAPKIHDNNLDKEFYRISMKTREQILSSDISGCSCINNLVLSDEYTEFDHKQTIINIISLINAAAPFNVRDQLLEDLNECFSHEYFVGGSPTENAKKAIYEIANHNGKVTFGQKIMRYMPHMHDIVLILAVGGLFVLGTQLPFIGIIILSVSLVVIEAVEHLLHDKIGLDNLLQHDSAVGSNLIEGVAYFTLFSTVFHLFLLAKPIVNLIKNMINDEDPLRQFKDGINEIVYMFTTIASAILSFINAIENKAEKALTTIEHKAEELSSFIKTLIITRAMNAGEPLVEKI